MCPEFSSCGGELTGRWDAESFCVAGDRAEYVNASEPVPECRALYLSVLYQSVISSLDFTAGSSLGGTITYHSLAEVELTNTCSLAILGSDVTPELCATFSRKLASQGWDEPVNCDGSSVCYCSSAVTQGPSSVIYNTSTGELLSANGEKLSYCVKGDRMQLKDRSQGIDIVINYVRTSPPGI